MDQPVHKHEGVIVITGGASGIGKALAQGLLESGWNVLALDVQQKAIDAVQAELHDSYPERLRLEKVDVTNEAAVEEAVHRCENEFGPIHGLVNSAGIGAEIPCLDTDVATFRHMMDVNVIGSFISARTVARKMKTRKAGSIVHITSISGLRGNYGRLAYGASKGAIINMTYVMAVELAEFGIRVNALAPGPIDTPLTKLVHTEAARRNWIGTVAMRRYGEAQELCGPTRWLLDEASSSYVTGQIIAVDGGFTATGLPIPYAW